MGAVADILITPAKIYKAPVGETKPSESTVDYDTAWGGNWVDLGYTLEPVSLSYDRSIFELMVEQETSPVKRQVDTEAMAIETVLAETTATNLALALGGTVATTSAGAGQRAFESLAMGGNVQMDSYAWGFEGFYENTAGAQFPVRIFFHKGTGVLNGDLTFAKSEGVGINLHIDATTDASQSTGEKLMLFQRVTAIASDE